MKRVIILSILILLFGFSTYGGEGKVLKTASDSWPPFIDPQNPKGGLSVEIATAAYATQGFSVEHKIEPWARAMQKLKNGDIDIIVNAWITEERKTFLYYSDPYVANEIKFIKLIDDSFEYNGLKSLKGKTVGTLRGYGYSSDFNNATYFKRVPVKKFRSNIAKLLLGRIDLTIEDEIVAKAAISQQDSDLFKKIAFSKHSLSKRYLFVTSGFKNPKHKEYIAAFNKGLKVIKANGTFDKIMKSYGIE